jgi:hypothetical protein
MQNIILLRSDVRNKPVDENDSTPMLNHIVIIGIDGMGITGLESLLRPIRDNLIQPGSWNGRPIFSAFEDF